MTGRDGALAADQAALVAALTGTGPAPAGFDATRVEIARQALLRKRAGEVATTWPLLAAALAGGLHQRFCAWAATRPTRGALWDGWAFARALAAAGDLPCDGRFEVAAREASMRFRPDGRVRRRLVAIRSCRDFTIFAVGGRVVFTRRR